MTPRPRQNYAREQRRGECGKGLRRAARWAYGAPVALQVRPPRRRLRPVLPHVALRGDHPFRLHPPHPHSSCTPPGRHRRRDDLSAVAAVPHRGEASLLMATPWTRSLHRPTRRGTRNGPPRPQQLHATQVSSSDGGFVVDAPNSWEDLAATRRVSSGTGISLP